MRGACAIRRGEAAIGEQAPGAPDPCRSGAGQRSGGSIVVGRASSNAARLTNVEHAGATGVCHAPTKRACFAKHRGSGRPRRRQLREPEGRCDADASLPTSEHPPIRPRQPGWVGVKRRWREMQPFGIGDGAVLLAPAGWLGSTTSAKSLVSTCRPRRRLRNHDEQGRACAAPREPSNGVAAWLTAGLVAA